MGVDRALEALVGPPAQGLEEFKAREGLPGVFQEEGEKVELHRAQLDRPAVDPRRVLGEVEADPSHLED